MPHHAFQRTPPPAPPPFPPSICNFRQNPDAFPAVAVCVRMCARVCASTFANCFMCPNGDVSSGSVSSNDAVAPLPMLQPLLCLCLSFVLPLPLL